MKTITALTKTLALVERKNVYYGRINLGAGKYTWQSLGIPISTTANRKKAEQAALMYAGTVANMQKHGQPITQRTFGAVIAEYVKTRTAENQAGVTSDAMLRQIVRVSKLWDQYAGTKPIAAIGDKELQDYVLWRINYYSRNPMPKNAARHPKDKTIKWETTFAKSILIWAKRQGYYGDKSLPTWSFKVKNKGVRPAFTWSEYGKLWRALVKWQNECGDDTERSYTRALLRDYVLVLANSGIRVGEANNLRIGDLIETCDDKNRRTYILRVNGKTGKRPVVLRFRAATYIDRVLARHPTKDQNDFLFCMKDGGKIITLADQFNKVLEMAGISRNCSGEKFSLYSLRHYYAVGAMRRNLSSLPMASNMGTGVNIIENYYGKSAIPTKLLTILAD